jgi:hypothetical protein
MTLMVTCLHGPGQPFPGLLFFTQDLRAMLAVLA